MKDLIGEDVAAQNLELIRGFDLRTLRCARAPAFNGLKMTMTTTAAQFADLLRHQAETLAELIAIGEQQQAAIDSGRMTELISILSAKQPVLEQLEQTRQKLHQARIDVKIASFWPDEAFRQRCQTLRDAATEGFQTLLRIEGECERSMGQARDAIRDRLQALEGGQAAASAYQSHSITPPTSQLDLSSLG